MKNQLFYKWSLALLVTVLPLAGGCLQQIASAPDPKGAETNDAVSATATNSPAKEAEELKMEGVPAVDISEAPVKAVATSKPLPANVRSNGPVAEIMKLADSGVEESVLLAYVTNSPSMFSLSADEIIYLNDIGVPGTVVTAMLQHDQALKLAPPQNVWSQAPVSASTNELQAQAQAPAPAEIAPQQVAAEPPPQPVQEVPPAPAEAPTYSSFYDTLAPYGTWVDVQGYGPCWQPTTVVMRPSWRPYYDNGHWVYSDYGWYWVSDYSWGWAPFHYGRWFCHSSLGWCWYPGYTWGASWVSWRYTGGYCGWAPLPPCAVYRPGIGLTYWGHHVGVSFGFGLGFNSFAFVSWNNFHDHHYNRHPVPHGQAHQVYQQSVVSTRIVGNRSHVFNQGLPVDQVARATRTDVQKVAVRETSNINGRGLRGDRLAPDGKSLTVYRPKFPDANSARLASTGPATPARPGTARNLPSETLPQGALKPVPVSASRVERPAPDEVRRPIPATALASATERPNRSAVEPSKAANNRGNLARATQPQQRPAANQPASRYDPSGNNVNRSPAVQASRPNASTQASRSPASAPPTARPAPNIAYNWQADTSTRSEPTPRSPWSTARQSTPGNAQASPAARPQRDYGASVQSQSPAAPRYAPAPNQSTAQRYNSTPAQPYYQAPARTAEVPRYNPPAYQAPTPSYQAPPRPAYQAPAPSYQAPSRSYEAPARSYTPPPAAPAAPAYSAPSRPSSSTSSSDSRTSSSGNRPR